MEVKLIDDILDYEENILIGMSLRQTVLSVIGVILIAVSYFLTYTYFNSQAASYVAIGLGLPCFLFAFLRPQKMRLEKYIAVWIRTNLLSLRFRVWQTENIFYRELWQGAQETVKVDVILHEYDRIRKTGIAGAEITVSRIEKTHGKRIETPVFDGVTGEDGTVQIADLLPGTYKWACIPPDTYMAGKRKPAHFTVRDNGKTNGTLGFTCRPYMEQPVKEKPQIMHEPKIPRATTNKKQRVEKSTVAVMDEQGNIVGYANVDKKGNLIMKTAQTEREGDSK